MPSPMPPIDAAAGRGSDNAPEASRDNPEAYIARDRRRALAAGMELPDRVSGSALFADISGFTPLTEALASELGPERGAEELTVNIGRVFHAVIAELDEFNGDVIYFSGDAVTCWIDGDDGTLACAAALAMQAAIERTGTVITPGGTQVQLAMKVAVAVGDARRFVVGDPEIQLIDVLAGRLIDDLAAAEHSAQKGDIILEQSAIERLGDRVTLGERREDHETGRVHAVLAGLLEMPPRSPVEEPPPLPEDLVRPWLLPPVYERLRTGRGEFLTELRPAIPVFLRFSGIDFDDDEEAVLKLDEFVRGAQKILSGYGGNVLQLTLGDKGAYLYGVFGSPLAHEDDAARAAASALELRDLEKTTAAAEIQIGITRGHLRSGTYGHAMRRTFVCLGDAVNLSARLMSKAPPGQIFVTDEIQAAAGDSFLWERLPDMTVKGKSAPVVAHALQGTLERASRRKLRFELRLVGRKRELATLNAGLADALEHRGRVIGIAAEAGMGKSRLVAEFVRSARRRGIFVAFGEFQAFGTNTSYFAWREVWRRLLRLEDDASEVEQIAQLETEFASIDPSLVPRIPLLDTVLGIEIPDSDLTESFDPKLRKASLEDLLTQALRARAATEPLVIVLEDCHWIDELSRDLLQVLTRAAPALRLVFVLAYRPSDASGGGLGVEGLPNFEEIVLDRLDDADAAEVVASKLEQVLGHGEPPSRELVELVTERADGNPLYIEELVSFIAGQHIDPGDRHAMRGLQLPDSLHALVLSRIDTVAEDARRSMKVAAVIGRAFEAPILPGAYPELGALDDVLGHLETLRTADLVALDREADLAFLFKHVVTQEVAYQSMPFSVRSMLHGRVGAYIEAHDPEGGGRQLDLLAHHYWLGDDALKKVEYLGRAAASASAGYANAAAIDYYERLIPLLDGIERAEAALSLAEVLQLTGEIPRAREIVLEARERAASSDDQRTIARCDHSLAESARRQGRFDEAADRLLAARRRFEAVNDEAGVATALQVTGTVNAQRGNLEAARAAYQEGMRIRERLGDTAGVAALTNNLAIVAQHHGDLGLARELGLHALDLYTGLGDRRRICACEINLAWMDAQAGRNEDALRHGEEAIRLAREVGDRLNLAIAQNNLGDALRDLGRLEEAGMAYGAAVEGYRDLGDTGPLMALLEDVAVLATLRSRPADAFTLLGAADALRASLGSPRPPAAETSLAERLAASRAALGDSASEDARQAGAALLLADAVDLALASARRGSG
ncbi:MAG: AAA family ATPase [Chloroflexi bacterium]|nr:AAA family ATPase [Chloroflexota bacterium]